MAINNSISRQSILAVVLGTCVVLAQAGRAVAVAPTTPDADTPQIRTTAFSHQAWNGLDLDAIDPNWQTETAIVKTPEPVVDPNTGSIFNVFPVFNPSGSYSNTGGAFISSNDYGSTNGYGNFSISFQHFPPPPPVKLLDSNSDINVDTQAAVHAYDDTFEVDDWYDFDGDSGDEDGHSFNGQLSYIANVFDDRDPSNFLAGSHAYADQDANVTAPEYNLIDPQWWNIPDGKPVYEELRPFKIAATGSISALSILDTGVPDADASATASSDFSSSFELHEGHDFTLAVEISATEDVSLTVALTDYYDSDEILFLADSAQFDEESRTWTILLEGYLPTGSYTLSVDAETNPSIDADGDLVLGGDAQYDLEFDLMQLDSFSSSLAFAAVATPEPGTLAMLGVGVALLARRRRTV